ncbi:MAG: hypothetical protein PHT12_05135 [Patescibacteria group bacterium]|nr:hypothetical protein [Patescibacteria group bacterium]
MAEAPVSAEIAREYLRDVEPMWKAFWFHMHLVAKNLPEFADGLAQISDDVFAYHASGQKNDLAAWVQEVIGDAVLARQLRSARNKEESAKLAAERVVELKRALNPQQ